MTRVKALILFLICSVSLLVLNLGTHSARGIYTLSLAFGLYAMYLIDRKSAKDDLIKRKATKKKKKDMSFLVDYKNIAGSKGLATFKVNNEGKVIAFNKAFEKIFRGNVKKGTYWDDFLLVNCKKETKSLFNHHYRYKKDMKSELFIYTNFDIKDASRTGVIMRMDTFKLRSLAHEHKELLQTGCVNIEDMIDDYIANSTDNYINGSINLSTSNYSENVELFVTEHTGQEIVSRFLNLLTIARSKYFKTSKISIKTNRDDRGFHIYGELFNGALSKDKLSEYIEKDDQVLNIITDIQAIEDVTRSYDITVSIKNVMDGRDSSTIFHFCIDDINNVQQKEVRGVVRDRRLIGDVNV
jgi:macrodomain Ter protein organizer (MatP/YcbG family)